MQLVNTTLATHTDSLKELIQYCIAHDIEGKVNLDIKPDGTVNIWQPENMPVAESVTAVPKLISKGRIPCCDEQPSDTSNH